MLHFRCRVGAATIATIVRPPDTVPIRAISHERIPQFRQQLRKGHNDGDPGQSL